MPFSVVSRSESQTAELAGRIADVLGGGDVVFLRGELGTGKTFFTRAAARRLGVEEPVTSPSFTMGQTYEGRMRVHHLDLYRMATFHSLDYADFQPYFESDAVTFIEWPQKAEPFLEKPALAIDLEHVDPHSRRLTLRSGEPRIIKVLEEIIADTGN